MNTTPSPDPTLVRALAANLASVRARIDAAARRAGRDASDVRLVAVTKYVDAKIVAALAAAGVGDVGENRTASLLEKRAALGTGLRWHLIGHLQRNKARRTLPAIDFFHAGDSLRLLRALDEEVARAGQSLLPVLVQVNAGGEDSKGGFDPAETLAAVLEARSLQNLSIRGLMTMAPFSDDPEDARPVFGILRELRDDLASRGYLDGRELSMGMSGDFEVAVEEGATMVRIGRVLYRGVDST